ncbi:MAG: MATE family efflux transporter, partial [Nocardioidaceae bacterium]
VVFVLDGVLIGAGDGRYLAWGGVVVLAVFAPLAAVTVALQDTTGPGLAWLWVVFGVGFIGSRAVVLLHRARGTTWMVTGATG